MAKKNEWYPGVADEYSVEDVRVMKRENPDHYARYKSIIDARTVRPAKEEAPVATTTKAAATESASKEGTK